MRCLKCDSNRLLEEVWWYDSVGDPRDSWGKGYNKIKDVRWCLRCKTFYKITHELKQITVEEESQ